MTQHELTTKILELVSIESTNDNPAGLKSAITLVGDMLQAHPGVQVEYFEQNGKPSLLAYAGSQRPKHFNTLLCAHADVVPGTAEQFSPFIQGNRLYGRGAYDMKAATIVMADVLLETAGKTNNKVGLIVVSDEEVGGFDCIKMLLQKGITADFAIYGEMTDLQICNETRGICWAEINFKGVRSHSGYPWEGKNAITTACDYIAALLAIYPVPADRTWTTSVNVSALNTPNTLFNLVPDTATLKVDIRFTPHDSNFASQAKAKRFLESIGFGAQVKDIPIYSNAVEVKEDNPHLKRFMSSFERKVGSKPKLIKRYASSDTRHFADVGIPCIEIGLTGSGLHCDVEYVDLSSLQPYKDLLVDFLLSPTTTPMQALPTQKMDAVIA